MNVLIQGLGSIAKKHLDAIKYLDPKANIYALRSGKGVRSYNGVINLEKLDEAKSSFDFAIISNPTNYHFESISNLSELNIPLFIEKPVLGSLSGAAELLDKVENTGIPTYVACNMRFLPVLKYIKQVFENNRPIEVRSYCGSFLPDWRPGIDYRESYSAKSDMGGGVHLDLIHELDYLYYLLGEPIDYKGFASKVSDLEIDSPDYAHYHLNYGNTMASVTLNYFRKVSKRDMEIVFENAVWSVDFLSSRIIDQRSDKVIFASERGINETYLDQMEYFQSKILAGEKPMNDLREAIEVLKICLDETT